MLVEQVSARMESPADGSDPKWADDPANWAGDSRVLEKLPPVMIIRPTRFPRMTGGVANDNRFGAENVSIQALLQMAHKTWPTRTVSPPDMPPEHYDLLYTLPGDFSTVLPRELARRFGYTAHGEMRETDVLLLEGRQHERTKSQNCGKPQGEFGGFHGR